MPQLVVNMEDTVSNKDCRNTKNNRFKVRHAPYSNRCIQFKFEYLYKLRNLLFSGLLN